MDNSYTENYAPATATAAEAAQQQPYTPQYVPGYPQAVVPHSQPAYYATAATTAQKPENLFKPEISDFVFALIVFILGYIFTREVLFSWRGWIVSVFTTAYLLTVTVYLVMKGVFAGDRATWFWMLATWITGLSYALWENAGFVAVRALFLYSSAIYYVIVASGRAIMGRTSNYLLVDGFNALIIIPFRNFINQYVSFSAIRKGKKRGRVLPVILGLAITLVLALILIPMLEQADSGGFGKILNSFKDVFTRFDWDFVLYAVLSIPVSAYLYGLVSGVVYKKGSNVIKPESAQKTVQALRILHSATIYTVLGAICVIYTVFIFSQLPYFFSAFTGRRPDGWLIYSEYARRGFFELCSIATINLVIITIGNLTSKKHRNDMRMLKIFNIILAAITLVLIATAFSKMALYIGAYGLTMPRLLPCVFMVGLGLVFIAVIIMQKWDFSIVRFALITGAVMLAALCLLNPDAIVVRYNTDRYLSGTLSGYDAEILYRAGSAGVSPAIEVLERTNDAALKTEIENYLRYQRGAPGFGGQVCLESFRAREEAREELLNR